MVRVAGLYAVGGWASFQVVNGLFPALGMPPWTVSLAALIFLAGFPVAVVLAWMFESTPEGIRLVPRDRRRFGAGQFGWIDWLIATVVVALFGFAIFQISGLRQGSGSPLSSAFAATPARSVAVLPFVSFSTAQGDGFFADGLTEELINSLAQSPELKVAGRTSSFYFKGRNLDLREIGRKLGVAHVVEGSVRRAGERLRVTAQLISVADGFHLWSQTFDRNLDDALSIQTDVANAVAQVLKARLVGHAAAQASDPDDYRLALIARAQLRTQDVDELRQARSLFADLRARDPTNAAAHAGYAQATILLAQNFLALPFEPSRREAAAAIARALEVAPKSADAWRARGAFERVLSIRTGEGSHHKLAIAAFRRALELDPRDPETMTLLGKELLGEGQNMGAVALVRRALVTDPLSRTAQEVMANALAADGKFDEAHRAYEALLSLYPDYTSGVSAFAQMLIFKQGRLDEAARLLSDPKVSAEDPFNALLLANCLANLGVEGGPEEAIGFIPDASPARPVAQAALLQLGGRRTDLLTYALASRARSGDPIWGSIEVVESAVIGEVHAARAALPANFPALLAEPPDISGYRDIDVLMGAYVLQKTGAVESARQILEAQLHRIDGAPFLAADQLAARGMTLAALGRKDEAIAAFAQAASVGWRTPLEFDYFLKVWDYPFMADVARDPRFRKLIAAVQKDNARMRQNIEKVGAPATVRAR